MVLIPLIATLIHRFTQNDWYSFNNHYLKDREAQTFLSNYDYPDVVVGELNGNSNAVWGISPPAQVSTEITSSLDTSHTQLSLISETPEISQFI